MMSLPSRIDAVRCCRTVAGSLGAHEITDRLADLVDLASPVWLTGGVAIDFLVGRWTRPHKDLDLIAFSTERSGLHDELRRRGVRLVNDGTWTTRWTSDGRPVGEIEIVFVEPASPNTGVVVIPQRDPAGGSPGRYALAPNYLAPDNWRELDGIRFLVGSAEGEWLHRLRGARLVDDRMITAEIEHDMTLLAELIPEERRQQLEAEGT